MSPYTLIICILSAMLIHFCIAGLIQGCMYRSFLKDMAEEGKEVDDQDLRDLFWLCFAWPQSLIFSFFWKNTDVSN